MQSTCRKVITSLFYPIVNAKAADAERRAPLEPTPDRPYKSPLPRRNRAACDACPVGHASAEIGSRPEPDDDPAYQQPRRGPAFPPIDPRRGDRRRNYRKDEADQLRLMPRDPKTGAQSRGDREAAAIPRNPEEKAGEEAHAEQRRSGKRSSEIPGCRLGS